MAKRKKRLKKGIESLEEQIDIHKEKRKSAEQSGNEELVKYYNKEIEAKEQAKKQKQEMLDKQ